ncbi:hypothetical protein [Oricola thermophila]|uniref:Uncharacterized protein n=1 Tax=Oricola thermophila TaxID=2742145 RepID=A0A6N1V8T2_9HYPH|nr:hypothetical protein [Oricola thermophila]QKV17386.1 hypothetical protein HTY61_02340 [Oricola thermophila]
MKRQLNTMRIAAAALLGLAAVAMPASADEYPQDRQVVTDAMNTGSISSLDRACNPDDPNADIVCRITRGNPDPKFPSVPVNPAFGL